MTAAQLLGLITAALLAQLTVGVGVVMLRRRSRLKLAPLAGPADRAVRTHTAWVGWREFRVAERVIEDAQGSQCSFHLKPVDGQPLPAFKPGQFLTFSLELGPSAPQPGATPLTATRCYSLSDGPDPTRYRVTIKRVPAPEDHTDWRPGLCSSHFHDHVQVGDVLRVKAPAGHFFIDPDPGVPVVLIGGGIGITPMMSMLRWCVQHQPQRPVHLFYGLRSSQEHAFKRALEDLAASASALRLHVVYSRPGAEDLLGRDYQHRGHVDVDLLRRTLPHGRHQFYVCGPAPMMQTLVPALADWGVAAADIHHEAFGPASVKVPGLPGLPGEPMTAAATSFEVKLQRSGRTLTWSGQETSLLEFVERHGVEVASGCRSGGCGSCETRVLEGRVLYAQAPDHEVAPGHCLLCVGRPASALVLEA
ncbi:MAG: 2Fe-2S iron-sulfur cluster-binding protein [Betaproteobacteria bacterium]|jgi:ferredoxin-NADP reductase